MTEPRTFRMKRPNTWGNTLFWWKTPDEGGRGEIHGHQSPRPRPGDRIICPIQPADR